MITHAQYRQIKAMKREQLDAYLNSVFAQGYNNGVVTMSGCMVEKIDKGLRKTSGVGEKRYEEIMKNITECLMEDADGDDQSTESAHS